MALAQRGAPHPTRSEKDRPTRIGKTLALAALAGLLTAGFAGAPGHAENAAVSSTPGVTVTRKVPMAMETLRDIQALAPLRGEAAPRDRAIPFHPIPRPHGANLPAPGLSLTLSPAGSSPLSPVPMAPALDTSFAGLANPDPSTTNDVIPPDTMGAAGPAHLVSILNSELGIFNKGTGALLTKVSMPSFWASLGTAAGQPANNPFDPKILFDQYSGRFIAITLGVDNDANGNSVPPSWIMIAVSAAAGPQDPNAWVKAAIQADLDNNVSIDNNWADYPGLGVDANNIYVSANMFNTSNSFQYSKVWVVPKSQLFGAPPPSLTWTEFRNPPGSRDTMQPAHTFGVAPAEYFVFEGLVGSLHLARISTSGATPAWSDLGQVSVTPYTSSSALPGAPQFGDPNPIHTGDTSLLNAVYRNGSLWTTHHVLGAGGRLEVGWYQIDPAAPGVLQQGRIGDPARWYYYPSIAVNQNGDAAVGFSGSSPAEYASGFYTARKSTDPAGSMQPPNLLKSGVATYFKTFSGTKNRWGDFSATVVDPNDDVTFWTLQEYAESPVVVRGSVRSMWGTWWGTFRPPAIAAPTGLVATESAPTLVDLAWTPPGGEQGLRVERRRLPAGDFSSITPTPLPPGTASYADNVGLVAGVNYAYRVQAFNASGSSYSNEATTALAPAPAAPSSGGGGGGCAVASRRSTGDPSAATGALLYLFLPAGILAARSRIIRRRLRVPSSAPPPGRPGAP